MPMNKRALSYAGYWRNSLADASLGQGAFNDTESGQFNTISQEEFEQGRLHAASVQKLFEGKDEGTPFIPVIFRPHVYNVRVEHGILKSDGSPAVITPIIGFAKLGRSGRLHPSSTPVVPRDILEPLEAKTFSIGSVDDLDTFLGKERFTELVCDEPPNGQSDDDAERVHAEYWDGFKTYCTKLFDAVAGEWRNNPLGYEKADDGFIVGADSMQSAARHVLDLYDHLRRTESDAPLFETYARDTTAPLKKTLPANSLVAGRLAHAGSEYALASAQRDALTHILAGGEGDILAVNGPPGTGKTTLVLSLVATLWAKAAIHGDEPPVIIATSANNQAASNVIDAFGKDFSEGTGPLAGRWLPEVCSYGAYFPSRSMESKVGDKYQTESFFQGIENQPYLESAERYYLEKARRSYDIPDEASVSGIVSRIKQELISLSQQLAGIEPVWKGYLSAKVNYASILGDDANASMAAVRRDIQECTETMAVLQDAQRAWLEYLANESIWYSIFSWLPAVRNKRNRLARLFVEKNFGQFGIDCTSINEVEVKLGTLLATEERNRQSQLAKQNRYDTAVRRLKQCQEEWLLIVESFGLARTEATSLEVLDEHLDVTIRFRIFRLAVHYWEGRWLQEVRERLKEVENHRANGLKATQRRWRRRMMVTPCIVSTLYMLPRQMIGTKREDDKSYTNEYHYNFIDLLLIDEGGLIPPDLAGASMALAKRAVVIGDTRQIEPIQSVSSQVDMGNLHQAGLLSGENHPQQYGQLKELGKTAFGGSVMTSAQALSVYHYDRDLERGLYLYEHRRCYNEIIQFCNELCYDKKLIPKRGGASSGNALPTMGHLHIDGLGQKAIGGSRYNELEAQTIASWLAAQRKQLESTYGKGLGDIVCVITPFGRQADAISRACRNEGIRVGKEEGEMVVGTVHAIQGAERPVVIFSPVYSKHADGPFIDRSSSMLNVAVSRAKDHFLVFGDMDVFTAHQGRASPRGHLASYLFQSPHNAIDFPALPRKDLARVQKIATLYNADAHDRFLLGAIGRALDEVHIVTPWIRRDFLDGSSVLETMADAATRRVIVNVYTDFDLNCSSGSYGETLSKRRQLFVLMEWLKGFGVHLIPVKRVHSKVVMVDSNILCIGSFNWFSASRQGPYVRHETSLVYRDTKVKEEIKVIKASLSRRLVKLSNPR